MLSLAPPVSLSLCLSVSLPLCLFVSLCLSVSLSLCLSVSLSLRLSLSLSPLWSARADARPSRLSMSLSPSPSQPPSAALAQKNKQETRKGAKGQRATGRGFERVVARLLYLRCFFSFVL